MSQHWSDLILAFDPCAEGFDWVRSQPDFKTAWATCTRGDWMDWWLDCTEVTENGNLNQKNMDTFHEYLRRAVRVSAEDRLSMWADTIREFYPEPPMPKVWT